MQISSDKGYSLIEVLVGLFIFSVGALASGVLIVSSMHQNQLSRERSTAASLVGQRLEELRDRPWFDNTGAEDLQAGGTIFSDDQLRVSSESGPTLDAAYSETFNAEGTGPRDVSTAQQTYFIVMWRIEDLNDSGLDFKRITIKCVSMHWHATRSRWEPAASFDHIAMVFRELKAQ